MNLIEKEVTTVVLTCLLCNRNFGFHAKSLLGTVKMRRKSCFYFQDLCEYNMWDIFL